MKNCSASESDALPRSTQMSSSTRTRRHRRIVHDGKDCLLSKQHKIQIMYLWSLETICKHNKQVKRIWHHQTETLDCGVSQQGTNVSGDLWTFSHWSNLPHRNDFRTKTRPSAHYRKTPAVSVRACLMSLLKGEHETIERADERQGRSAPDPKHKTVPRYWTHFQMKHLSVTSRWWKLKLWTLRPFRTAIDAK